MKILYVTTISLTMNSFFKPHIEMLVREGHQVDIACNDSDLPLDALYGRLGCQSYRIDFSRSPLSADNIKAYGQLKKVVEKGRYDIVHCHTPNAAVIARLVCRKFRKKYGLKVFYTAHGFHFYKGAPLKNWLLYYPVEKICSCFTDVLITINREDYHLAQKRMKASRVEYVPGVGVNAEKFRNTQADRKKKRTDLGIPEDALLLLSVGELNKNKNQQIILRALAGLKNPGIHYALVGIGDQADTLKDLAQKLGISSQVHFLGYRHDVMELCHAADVFCHPSYREGLPVSIIEAMASGLPCVVSQIRGNVDLIDEQGGAFFDPFCTEDCIHALEKTVRNDLPAMGRYNQKKSIQFSTEFIYNRVKYLYQLLHGESDSCVTMNPEYPS